MKAMILAAGLGERLKEYTQDKPKPMIDINGKPLLDLTISLLKKNGINEIIANLYYLPEVITKHVKYNDLYEGFYYLIEESLSGTAGGLLKCFDFFENEKDFVVMSGDLLTDINLKEMIKQHRASKNICTMAVRDIDISEVGRYGVVVIDENSQVTWFQEKPKVNQAVSTYINAGIYVFDKKIFKYISSKRICDFAKNILPTLMLQDKLGAYVIGDDYYWNDIGTKESYLQALFDANMLSLC